MVLFATKLNDSIKSGGVTLCSQLRPRLNNFYVKEGRERESVFFLAGSKLPCLYFWAATVSVFFQKVISSSSSIILFVISSSISWNLLELWCLCWIKP